MNNSGKLDKNGKALVKAYDSYAKDIYRYALFRTSSKETAEDITSSTFVKTWEYVDNKGNVIKNYRAFLYRTAHNLIVDYYKQKSRSALSLEDLTESQIPAVDSNYPEISHNKQEAEKVKKAIKKLKPEHQDIVSLRFIEGFSLKEIAEIHQKSPNAVSIIVHRALKEIQQIL